MSSWFRWLESEGMNGPLTTDQGAGCRCPEPGLHLRALAIERNGEIVWIWIGSLAETNKPRVCQWIARRRSPVLGRQRLATISGHGCWVVWHGSGERRSALDDLAETRHRATMRRDPLSRSHHAATRRIAHEKNCVCGPLPHGCARTHRLRQPGSHVRLFLHDNDRLHRGR